MVVRTQAGVADAVPAGIVGVPAGLRDGLDGVGASLCGGRRDGEENGLGISRGLAMELRLGGSERQPSGSLSVDRAFGRGLGVDRDANRQCAAVERQDARLGLDADADGGRDDERLVECRRAQ